MPLPRLCLAMLGTLLVSCSGGQKSLDLRDVNEIQFWEKGKDGKVRRAIISDPGEVKTIIETMKLKEKDPCKCAHLRGALVLSPRHRTKITLCEHCLDTDDAYFQMPPAFYKQVKKRLDGAKFGGEETITETTVGRIADHSVGVGNIWESEYTTSEGKKEKGRTGSISVWKNADEKGWRKRVHTGEKLVIGGRHWLVTDIWDPEGRNGSITFTEVVR